jgi:hypothetical protein
LVLACRAEGKSGFPPSGIDDIEFLLNPQDNLVFFMSNSRDIIFAGTQVVGDGGSNVNRLNNIKRSLGWQDMGVEDSDVDAMKYIQSFENMNIFTKLQRLSMPAEINFLDNTVPGGSDLDSVTVQ